MPEDLKPLFIIIFLIFFGLLLYIVWWWRGKYKEELLNDIEQDKSQLQMDIQGLAKNQHDMGEYFTSELMKSERRLQGRIYGLELHSPYAIFEQDLKTGLILHANEQFTKMLGWTIDELNAVIGLVKDGDWLDKLIIFLIHPRSHTTLRENFQTLELKQNIEYQEVWIKTKQNIFFHAVIRLHFLELNGEQIIQGFISDETNMKNLLDNIKIQNRLIENFVRVFSEKAKDNEQGEELYQLLRKIKEQIRYDLQ